jgi:putative nucleotidyltransferase with HDIG domain
MILQKIYEQIDYLPVFNKVAQKAYNILQSDSFTYDALAEIINLDPGLTTNILKTVNSAAFATSRKINDLKTAVSFLGKNQIASIVMMSASEDYFKTEIEGYEILRGELWEHSLAVGVICQILAGYVSDVDKGTLFTAGLLHDIGKLVLNSFVVDEYDKIVHKVEDKKCSFLNAEHEVLGYTHAQVGAAVLRKWNFSKDIIDAVKYHHEPARTENKYAHIVSIADYIAFSIGKVSQKDALAYSGYEDMLIKYDFTNVILQQIVAEAWEKISSLLERLGS